MSEFRATLSSGLLTLSGEVDMTSALGLRQALEQAGAATDNTIIVEMSGVTFIDSSGLNELVRPTHDGRAITIRGAAAFVRRLFEVTGLDVVLTVETEGSDDLGEGRTPDTPHDTPPQGPS